MQLQMQTLSQMNSTVSQLIDSVLVSCTLTEEKVFELRVVLNELIVNAFTHDQARNALRIAVDPEPEQGQVLILLGHEAYTFDPSIITNPTLYAENGRGLLIVKELCSSLRRDDKQNCIIAYFPLNCRT